jgi:DNA replication licensing factor MCM3
MMCFQRQYSSLASFDAFSSTAAYPTQDEDRNPLQTEFGLSKYKDHQTLTVQEMSEKAPADQLNRSVDIIAVNDLVGSYKAMPGKQGGYTHGTFRTLLAITCLC